MSAVMTALSAEAVAMAADRANSNLLPGMRKPAVPEATPLLTLGARLAQSDNLGQISAMRYKSLFSFAKQAVYLVLAQQQRRKGKYSVARQHLSKVLATDDQSEAYNLALALDGNLMLWEGNIKQANARFAECLMVAKSDGSADGIYASAYSKLWFTITDESRGFESIEDNALVAHRASSDASRFAHLLLPLVSMEILREEFGHRKAKTAPRWNAPTMQVCSEPNVSLNF